MRLLKFLPLLLLTNCASFSDKALHFAETDLSHNTLGNLNGRYLINANRITDDYGNTLKNHTDASDLYTSIIPSYSIKNSNFTSKYLVQLKVISANEISVSLLENDSIIKCSVIKGKLKKDGYYYLKNTLFISDGIPFFFGHYECRRTRITLTDESVLFVNKAFSWNGAFFFLMAGESYNVGLEFDKIDTQIQESDTCANYNIKEVKNRLKRESKK
jgi:hypothetical protein